MEGTFVKQRETKGSWVFVELGSNPIIGTLYVKKTTLQAIGNPDKIVVSVEAFENAM